MSATRDKNVLVGYRFEENPPRPGFKRSSEYVCCECEADWPGTGDPVYASEAWDEGVRLRCTSCGLFLDASAR